MPVKTEAERQIEIESFKRQLLELLREDPDVRDALVRALEDQKTHKVFI